MINVLVYKESRFPADRERIKRFVCAYLQQKVKGDAEVGISIVGDRKMRNLNTKYRQISQTTDVLSFPLDDPSVSSREDIRVGFSPEKSSPDRTLRLGDVVVSYPQAVLGAAEDDKLVDEKIDFLIAHGLDHLLGIHHA